MANSQYEELATGVDNLREVVGALVAGLKTDGFSDEQARDIVAGIWRSMGRPTDDS